MSIFLGITGDMRATVSFLLDILAYWVCVLYLAQTLQGAVMKLDKRAYSHFKMDMRKATSFCLSESLPISYEKEQALK